MTRRPNGFTLIELLLAMGMVAMLTLSMYAGLSTAFRARLVVNAQTDSLRQAKAALDLAEQDLRSVLPPSGALAGPFYGFASGTADSPAASIDCYTLGSDFVAPVGSTVTEGIRHVVLSLSSDGTAPTLIRTVTRDLMDTSGGTPDTEILARNVTGFAATYFDGETWADSWDSTAMNSALPLAIDLTVSIKAPTTTDANHVYTLSRIVVLACGLTPDQAAAIATAAGTTSTDGSTTPTTPTGGGQ